MQQSEYVAYLKRKIRNANVFAAVVALCFLCAGVLFIVLRVLRPAFGAGFIVVGVIMLAFVGLTFLVRARYVHFLKTAIATRQLEDSFVPNKKTGDDL